MEFKDKVMDLVSKIEKVRDNLSTEEATKTALVMPFIHSLLGYDIFNPSEVVPEFTADTGTKKGEKVDYAIAHDGEIQILIEAKKFGESLRLKHASQLYRYFSVTSARIAILTNGTIYQFFSDLDAANKMDERPFLEIDFDNLDESLIPELKKLTKERFDLEDVLNSAGEMKYSNQIKKNIQQQFRDPDDELIRFLVAKVYEGKLTQTVKNDFKPIVKKAMTQYVNDQINERLQSAMNGGYVEPEEQENEVEINDRGIETTDEEIEGYNLIKAIVRKTIEPSRVIMRDTKSYCGVLIDDNNRKPLCRMHFNREQKYLGLFDDDKNETRHPIKSINDIFQFEEHLIGSVSAYCD
ncbi:type I restriction endonuclease [Marinobacter sp. 1Y8]